MTPDRIADLPNRVVERVLTAVFSLSPDDHGCLTWTGKLDRYGYGMIRFRVGVDRRRYTGAHRAAWIALRGSIPADLVIDHLCRNRACVNVEHMELVTTGENTRRSDIVGRGHHGGSRNRTKSECKSGHPLSPENTYIVTSADGYIRRSCIACRRRRSAEWKRRQKAA